MDVKFKKLGTIAVAGLLAATLTAPAPAAEKQTTSSTSKKTSSHPVHASKRTRKVRARGQKAIDGDRVRQIQEALIREHYLKGEPSGKWDASSQQAMHRYQSDQGWQSKTVPDSRALIRLGLGPDSQHLLNPESAMTMSAAAPAPGGSHPMAKTSASASRAASGSMPASAAQVSAPTSSISAVPTR